MVELCSSPQMLAELAEVLAYPKLAPRLQELGLTAMELTERAANLATIWEIPEVVGPPIVAVDPDDDIFLHCAFAAHADTILSGDGHLLDLCQYGAIPIMTVRDFLAGAFPELVD